MSADSRQIETLEVEIARLESRLAEPGFYQSGFEDVQKVTDALSGAQAQLETAFSRWSELEAMQ